MENEILKKIEEQDKKLAEIYKSVEKTRKYIFWTVVITIITILLPLIGLVFIIPWFLSTITSSYQGLGL